MSSLRKTLRALAITVVSAALLAPAVPARAEPSPAELTRRIEKSSAELEHVVETYNKLREEIKSNQAAVARVQIRLGPLEQETERSRADVSEMAVTAYKTGNNLSSAEVLLRPGGADTLLNRLGLLDQLARQRQAKISNFTGDQQRLLDEKTRLEVTLTRQAAQVKQTTIAKKRIERDLAALYELRRQAYGQATETPAPRANSAKNAPAISGRAGVAVRYAYGALGKPYVWAGDGPNGYDCSGLTSAAWRAAGKSLPHNTRMQWGAVTKISRSQLQPGDLVFYSGLGHVALYVGGGQVIDAPSAGRNVLKRGMNMMSIQGYGRVS